MPYKMTPLNPDPYTGFQNALVAWHFVGSEATDVLQGMVWLKAVAGRAHGGWDYHIYADPTNPLLQIVVITGRLGNFIDNGVVGKPISFIAKDTDYIGFNGHSVQIIPQAVATASFSITPYTLPTPPQAVPEAPPPQAAGPPPAKAVAPSVGPRRKTPPDQGV